MSVFGNIMSKVFGHANAQAAPTAPQQPSSTAPSTGKSSGPAPAGPAATGTSTAKTAAAPQQPSSTPSGKATGPAPAGAGAAGTSGPPTAAAPTAARVEVDVEAVLKDLASKNKEKLDWRNSIVDLMKLLNLDSSLSARKELANELNYTGNTQNSAAMNIWLHKQVMIKLAENGGKVPESLKT